MDIPFKWILPIESLPALEEEVAVLVDTSSYDRQKDFGYLWMNGESYKWELDHFTGKVLAWWPVPKENVQDERNETEQKD